MHKNVRRPWKLEEFHSDNSSASSSTSNSLSNSGTRLLPAPLCALLAQLTHFAAGHSCRETEHILDYYRSEDAGRAYCSTKNSDTSSHLFMSQHERKAPINTSTAQATMSTARSPRSNGGRDDTNGRPSMESVASSSGGVQRRTSQRSAGGTDRRRLAIVETDSETQLERQNKNGSSTGDSQSLFTRRGIDGSRLTGLSLVAPPDAKISNYTGLSSIPSSAPATGPTPIQSHYSSELTSSSSHHRSMSDVSSRRKNGPRASPRDVGIVGTMGSVFNVAIEESSPRHDHQRCTSLEGVDGRVAPDLLTAPVFQTPKSRSPSPLPATPDSYQASLHSTLPESGHSDTESPITPSIGQEKDIARPVAGPVVLDLNARPVVLDLNASPQPRRSPHTASSTLPYAPLTSIPPLHIDRDSSRSGRLPFKPNPTSLPFLHYQPGIHSTAGPLPSPPRHIITQPSSAPPPPRPPRTVLLSAPSSRRPAVTESEQCNSKISQADSLKPIPITSLNPHTPKLFAGSDYSISAVSVSSSGSDQSPRLSSSPQITSDVTSITTSEDGDQAETKAAGSPRPGSHVREGAFPASSVFVSRPSSYPTPQSEPVILDKLVASVNDVVSTQPDKEPSILNSETVPASHENPDKNDIGGLVAINSTSGELNGECLEERVVSSPSSYATSFHGESPRKLAAIVSEENLSAPRKTSLPLPPPPVEVDIPPRHGPLIQLDQQYEASLMPSQPASFNKKPPSAWPDAMNFRDILLKKAPAERAYAYSVRFRELAAEETGLRDWLHLTSKKERREQQPALGLLSVAIPSQGGNPIQPRRVSWNSTTSEMTFPIRKDSYIATDLSLKSATDFSSSISPPALPYPSLAQGIGRRPSRMFATESSSLASPTGSSGRSLGAGFFASLGRKTSVKRDKPLPLRSSSKLVSASRDQPPSRPSPQTRVVKPDTTPSLPGGPRAPARPTNRMNSVIMMTSAAAKKEEEKSLTGHSEETHQPSFTSNNHRLSEEAATILFDQHVQKLSDLLPHADKDVLAGYLRRAKNHDMMLAIGSYLSDQQQGRVTN